VKPHDPAFIYVSTQYRLVTDGRTDRPPTTMTRCAQLCCASNAN